MVKGFLSLVRKGHLLSRFDIRTGDLDANLVVMRYATLRIGDTRRTAKLKKLKGFINPGVTTVFICGIAQALTEWEGEKSNNTRNRISVM
jgi:hypothetical protein